MQNHRGHNMKLLLVLAGAYSSCLNTEAIWQQVCQAQGIKLEVTDFEQPRGREITQQLNIKSFPALIVDGEVKAVGHPDSLSAETVIKQIIANQSTAQ